MGRERSGLFENRCLHFRGFVFVYGQRRYGGMGMGMRMGDEEMACGSLLAYCTVLMCLAAGVFAPVPRTFLPDMRYRLIYGQFTLWTVLRRL